MLIYIPAQIILKRLFEYTSRFAGIHHHMVFKTISAYILHQALQVTDLRNGPVAKGVQRIVGKLAFTNIRFDDALAIIGAYSTVGKR